MAIFGRDSEITSLWEKLGHKEVDLKELELVIEKKDKNFTYSDDIIFYKDEY